MASSANFQKFRPTPNSAQSWASIAKQRPHQTSLFASPPTPPPTSPTIDSASIHHSVTRTVLFRAGRNDGSYFLDVSSRAEPESILFQTILQQYPSCRGAAPFKENGRRFIEINLDPQDLITNHTLLSEGIAFSDNKRIVPIRALPDGSNIKRVALSRMPFLSKSELLEGLQTTLNKYGSVHDIGISTDPISNMFLGSGYAIIDTTPLVDGTSYLPLTHNLPWPGMKNGFFATCTDMPVFCKYCHQDGHARDECPTAPPLRLCFTCNRPGHIAINCPRPSKPPGSCTVSENQKQKKKQTNLPSSRSSPISISNSTPVLSPSDDDELMTNYDRLFPPHQPSPSPAPFDPSDFDEINKAVEEASRPQGNDPDTDMDISSHSITVPPQPTTSHTITHDSDFELYPNQPSPSQPPSSQPTPTSTSTPSTMNTSTGQSSVHSLASRLDKLTKPSQPYSTDNPRRSVRINERQLKHKDSQ